MSSSTITTKNKVINGTIIKTNSHNYVSCTFQPRILFLGDYNSFFNCVFNCEMIFLNGFTFHNCMFDYGSQFLRGCDFHNCKFSSGTEFYHYSKFYGKTLFDSNCYFGGGTKFFDTVIFGKESKFHEKITFGQESGKLESFNVRKAYSLQNIDGSNRQINIFETMEEKMLIEAGCFLGSRQEFLKRAADEGKFRYIHSVEGFINGLLKAKEPKKKSRFRK